MSKICNHKALNFIYLSKKSGADAILIHSKENNPKEVFKFAKIFKKSKYFKPLVAVPSTYSGTSEHELIKNGFKIVIYANHLLRAAYPAMQKTALDILRYKKTISLKIGYLNK